MEGDTLDLIAVIGKMHAGKTTAATALQHAGFVRQAFADPVKEIGAAMLTTFERALYAQLGEPYEQLPFSRTDMNVMKGHPSIRALLQVVGTELGRNWHGPQDVWIQVFSKQFTRQQQTYAELRMPFKVIVDDCRFVNEAEALKKLGFTLVKLVRNESQRQQSVRTALRVSNPTLSDEDVESRLQSMLQHPSETEIDQIIPDVTVPSVDILQLQTYMRHLVSEEHADRKTVYA